MLDWKSFFTILMAILVAEVIINWFRATVTAGKQGI